MQRREFLRLFGLTAAAVVVPLPYTSPSTSEPPRAELDFMFRRSGVVAIGCQLDAGVEYLLRLRFEHPTQIRYVSVPPSHGEIVVEQIGDSSLTSPMDLDLGYFSTDDGVGCPVDWGIQNPLPIRLRAMRPEGALLTMVFMVDVFDLFDPECMGCPIVPPGPGQWPPIAVDVGPLGLQPLPRPSKDPS